MTLTGHSSLPSADGQVRLEKVSTLFFSTGDSIPPVLILLLIILVLFYSLVISEDDIIRNCN